MRRKNVIYRFLSVILAGSLLAGGVAAGNAGVSEAAGDVYLKNEQLKLDLNKKKTAKIKVKKAKGVKIKKVTYAVKKKKKVVTVSKTGKVTAKQAGSAEISVKVKYQKKGKTAMKKLLCKVIVKSGSGKDQATQAPAEETETPTIPAEETETPERPEVQTYENGDIKGVQVVLPENTQTPSESDPYGMPDNSWKEDAKKWQEKEKPIEMKKFYSETLCCFLSDEKNTVYSPINVYMALSMLAEVGSGETQSEILNLLQVKDTDTLREHIQALWNANYYDSSSAASILGNSLWLNNRVDYNESLLKTLAEYYYASSFSGTMGSEKYDQAVRDWVNQYTKGLLKDSVQDIKLEPDTVMDIISTIYFKAGWIDSFQSNDTKKETFHGKNGDKEVDMMHQSKHGSVYLADKFTGLSLGLSAGNMHFILPNENVALSEVIADEEVMDMIGVGAGAAEKRRENLVSGEIRISIPKFKIHSKINLTEGLKSLGIIKAFDPNTADFRALFADPLDENAYVSSASHAAMVEVDEDGVTGAAYTEMMMSATSMLDSNKIDFVLDRPFYYIVTADDGSILFAGTVYDIYTH